MSATVSAVSYGVRIAALAHGASISAVLGVVVESRGFRYDDGSFIRYDDGSVVEAT